MAHFSPLIVFFLQHSQFISFVNFTIERNLLLDNFRVSLSVNSVDKVLGSIPNWDNPIFFKTCSGTSKAIKKKIIIKMELGAKSRTFFSCLKISLHNVFTDKCFLHLEMVKFKPLRLHLQVQCTVVSG